MPSLLYDLFYSGIAVVVLLIIASIVLMILRLRVKRFSFEYNGKVFEVKVRSTGAKLFVDGSVVDEFEGRGVKKCMLKTFVNGDEFSVRVSFWPFLRVKAFVNGNEL